MCTEHTQEAQNVNLQAAVHYYGSQKGKDKDTTNIFLLHAGLNGRAATHTQIHQQYALRTWSNKEN